MNDYLLEELHLLIRGSKVDEAIKLAEAGLGKHQATTFHSIIAKNFLNLSDQLAGFIDEFYHAARKETKVRAIYAEMNGFTINYDLWFIDLFAFNFCDGLDDLDWLTDFEFSSNKNMHLTGFEELQRAYKIFVENKDWNNKELKETSEICEYLVILRLQELFREAKKIAVAKNLAWKEIPIFSTAHDYDMVYNG